MRRLMRLAFGSRHRGAAAPLLLAVAWLAAAGCGGAEERLPAVTPLTPARGPGYMRRMLLERSRALKSLQGTVRMAVRNPQFPGEFSQLRFHGGKLAFQAPANVHLRVPNSSNPRIKVTGNGDAYRVEMAQFQDSYTGRYGDPMNPQPGRVMLLPEEIVYALNPALLMRDAVAVPAHHEEASYLYILTRLEQPKPHYAFRASVWANRRTDRLLSLQVFETDGTLRSRIMLGRVDTLPDVDDKSVQVPTDIWITYPKDETNIRLQLDDITLNEKLEEGLFRLGRAPEESGHGGSPIGP